LVPGRVATATPSETTDDPFDSEASSLDDPFDSEARGWRSFDRPWAFDADDEGSQVSARRRAKRPRYFAANPLEIVFLFEKKELVVLKQSSALPRGVMLT